MYASDLVRQRVAREARIIQLSESLNDRLFAQRVNASTLAASSTRRTKVSKTAISGLQHDKKSHQHTVETVSKFAYVHAGIPTEILLGCAEISTVVSKLSAQSPLSSSADAQKEVCGTYFINNKNPFYHMALIIEKDEATQAILARACLKFSSSMLGGSDLRSVTPDRGNKNTQHIYYFGFVSCDARRIHVNMWDLQSREQSYLAFDRPGQSPGSRQESLNSLVMDMPRLPTKPGGDEDMIDKRWGAAGSVQVKPSIFKAQTLVNLDDGQVVDILWSVFSQNTDGLPVLDNGEMNLTSLSREFYNRKYKNFSCLVVCAYKSYQ